MLAPVGCYEAANSTARVGALQRAMWWGVWTVGLSRRSKRQGANRGWLWTVVDGRGWVVGLSFGSRMLAHLAVSQYRRSAPRVSAFLGCGPRRVKRTAREAARTTPASIPATSPPVHRLSRRSLDRPCATQVQALRPCAAKGCSRSPKRPQARRWATAANQPARRVQSRASGAQLGAGLVVARRAGRRLAVSSWPLHIVS